MIASLPMYWRAETAPAWQAFWKLAQEAEPQLPNLTAPIDLSEGLYAHWRRPDLALSMTCGLPFRTALKDRVTYVGTLHLCPDAPVGQYNSVLITHAKTAITAPMRLAYNGRDSQSGWAAQFTGGPKVTVIPTLETGAHAASLAAVAEGRADAAYLDGYTWRLLQAYDPHAKKVRVLGQTPPTPALPLITAKGRDPAPLQAAMVHACASSGPNIAAALGVEPQFTVLSSDEYYAQPIPPGFATAG